LANNKNRYYDITDKRKSIAAFLWFIGFFGCLNLHNFYLKKYKTGIVKTVLAVAAVLAFSFGVLKGSITAITLFMLFVIYGIVEYYFISNAKVESVTALDDTNEVLKTRYYNILDKKKKTARNLWFLGFFGCLSFHNFYLKKYKTGIVKAILSVACIVCISICIAMAGRYDDMRSDMWRQWSNARNESMDLDYLKSELISKYGETENDITDIMSDTDKVRYNELNSEIDNYDLILYEIYEEIQAYDNILSKINMFLMSAIVLFIALLIWSFVELYFIHINKVFYYNALDRKKSVALLLWFFGFFGCLNLHNFYLKKRRTGRRNVRLLALCIALFGISVLTKEKGFAIIGAFLLNCLIIWGIVEFVFILNAKTIDITAGNENAKDAKKSVAIALWFAGFFGSLNLHNFYMKKYKTGLIKTVLLFDLIALLSIGFNAGDIIILTVCALLFSTLIIWGACELVFIIIDKTRYSSHPNKLTVRLLWFAGLCGILNIHNFYLKKYKTGLIKTGLLVISLALMLIGALNLLSAGYADSYYAMFNSMFYVGLYLFIAVIIWGIVEFFLVLAVRKINISTMNKNNEIAALGEDKNNKDKGLRLKGLLPLILLFIISELIVGGMITFLRTYINLTLLIVGCYWGIVEFFFARAIKKGNTAVLNEDNKEFGLGLRILWLFTGLFISNELIICNLGDIILFVTGCLFLAYNIFRIATYNKPAASIDTDESATRICQKCGAEMPDGSATCEKCENPPEPKTDYGEVYDIFLSYRREGGETMAILLRERLSSKGYNVFLDIENLNSGSFNTKLLDVIDGCKDVIVICSKDALNRCVNDDDWVRLEIAHALKKGKNVVPIMLKGFEFPEVLPDEIEALRMQNGINANSHEYFDAAIDRLADKFLVSKPVSAAAKQRKAIRMKIRINKNTLMYTAAAVVISVAVWSGNGLFSGTSGGEGRKIRYVDMQDVYGYRNVFRDIVIEEGTFDNNGNLAFGKKTYLQGYSWEGTFDYGYYYYDSYSGSYLDSYRNWEQIYPKGNLVSGKMISRTWDGYEFFREGTFNYDGNYLNNYLKEGKRTLMNAYEEGIFGGENDLYLTKGKRILTDETDAGETIYEGIFKGSQDGYYLSYGYIFNNRLTEGKLTYPDGTVYICALNADGEEDSFYRNLKGLITVVESGVTTVCPDTGGADERLSGTYKAYINTENHTSAITFSGNEMTLYLTGDDTAITMPYEYSIYGNIMICYTQYAGYPGFEDEYIYYVLSPDRKTFRRIYTSERKAEYIFNNDNWYKTR